MRDAAMRLCALAVFACASGAVFGQGAGEREQEAAVLQHLRNAGPIPPPTDPGYRGDEAAAPVIIARDPASGKTAAESPPFAPWRARDAETTEDQAAAAAAAGGAQRGAVADPVAVLDTSTFPFRTVHKLLMRFQVGGLDYFFVCSATAVGEFHLLTTGNCIYNHDPNGDGNTSDQRFVEEVWAWAGQTDRIDPLRVEDFPFGLARGTFFRVPNGWINNQNLDDDWALITLDRRVGAHTGWMARETGVEAATLESTGYPAEPPFVPPGNMWQFHSAGPGNVVSYLPGRILFDALTFGGHSGGPVWRTSGGNRFLQGILSSSDRAGNSQATRLRAGMLDDINGFINDDEFNRPPTPVPDLIEYLLEENRKNLLTDVAAPGDTFEVEYNVFNAGHAPSGPITVDFYLSTNNFISSFDIPVSSISAGSLDPFFFFTDTVELTVPANLPAGVYWAGWIMRAPSAFEPNTFDNSAVIDTRTLLVTAADTSPDIRVEPSALDFREDGQPSGAPIFVEIDWMEDATHSHRPSQAVIDTIVATFAAAGHEIQIDVSNAIPHQAVIDIVNSSPGSSPQVQNLMNQHFDNAGDSRYYYSLWGHQYSFNGQPTGSSGVADLPGRVHLVTLGTFPDQTGTPEHQVGTMIHEFGHNLGQRHGGVDNGNFKPSYLSVMNYHYQLEGIGPALVALGLADDGSGFDDFSYSHGQQIGLDEASLDESVGIGLGNPADWNCNGTIETNVSADLQAQNWCTVDGERGLLTDFDNWSDLRPFIRTSSRIPDTQPAEQAELCITWKKHQPLYEAVQSLRDANMLPASSVRRRDGIRTQDHETALGAATPVQRSFTIYNDGASQLDIDQISLSSPAPWINWTPSSPFSIAAGQTRQISVRVDFAAAPEGETIRHLTIRSNDPDESPLPGGVELVIGNNTAGNDAEIVFVDGFES